MATTIGTLRTHTSGNADSATNLMYNLNLIRTAFNSAFSITTGHYHDGADSRLISGGITGWSFEDTFLLMYGSFGKGGL